MGEAGAASHTCTYTCAAQAQPQPARMVQRTNFEQGQPEGPQALTRPQIQTHHVWHLNSLAMLKIMTLSGTESRSFILIGKNA